MNPKSIIIAGYYGFDNAGDELILASLIQRFRRENASVEVTVLSNNPEETERCFGVKALPRWRPWTWFGTLARASRFILGAGGLLQESTGPCNHAYYLSLVVLAKWFGCTTEILSIGVDPIESFANRFLTRWVCKHWLDELTVRDRTSALALEQAGVPLPIAVRRDPVFDLLPGTCEQPCGVAFVLSPSSNRAEWAGQIASLCDRLYRQARIPMDVIAMFPREDETFCRQVAQASKTIRHIRIWQNPMDLLAWLPEYEVVVSTRFHALVIAANAKRPFIGWGGQAKVATLCQDWDQPYTDTEKYFNELDEYSRIVSLCQAKLPMKVPV